MKESLDGLINLNKYSWQLNVAVFGGIFSIFSLTVIIFIVSGSFLIKENKTFAYSLLDSTFRNDREEWCGACTYSRRLEKDWKLK